MLPNPESISRISSEQSQKLRQFLVKENQLLLDIISSNSQTLSGLQSILKAHQSEEKKITERQHPKSSLQDLADLTEMPYTARLKSSKPIPEMISKSKYFRLAIALKTKAGLELLSSERIELSVALYSNERVPQKIFFTMQGKDIFRGNLTAIMAYDIVENRHLAHFKLQINEVSSHFIGGSVQLIIQAKQSLAYKGIYIKPLVLKNLRIRAKEVKKE